MAGAIKSMTVVNGLVQDFQGGLIQKEDLDLKLTPGSVVYADSLGNLAEDPIGITYDPVQQILSLGYTLSLPNQVGAHSRPAVIETGGDVIGEPIDLHSPFHVSGLVRLTNGGTDGILASSDTSPVATATGTSALALGAGAAASAARDTSLGTAAGAATTTGADNTLVGYLAGTLLTTGSLNTFVGSQVASAADVTGSRNTFVGALAGAFSGAALSGSNNVAVGAALISITSGSGNMAVGTNAVRTCTTGDSNVGVGNSALFNLSSASGNLGLGAGAGYSVTTGGSNVLIGSNAGTVATTGGSNVCLGAAANVATGATDEAIALGHDALAAANEAVFGPHADSLSLSVVSGSGANRKRASLVAANVDNTDATRKYRLTLGAFDTAYREAIRFEGDGSAALLGFFGAAAVAQQSGDVAAALVNLGLLSTASGSARVLFDHFADAGNSTTTETDLYSDTLAAGQLSANGQKVGAEYGGVFVSSATATRQVKLYFGGTAVFDTGALTLSLSAAWVLYATIIRVSSSVVRYSISLTTEGAALAAYTAVGELTGLTLANTQVLKVTGQAAGVGAASNDIVAKTGSVSFAPAA